MKQPDRTEGADSGEEGSDVMSDSKPLSLDYWARELHDGDHPLIEEVRRLRRYAALLT